MKSLINQKRLHDLLHYDPETGIFTWIVNRYSVKHGAIAGYDNGGCKGAKGHRLIKVDDRVYMASRLAWLYMHGKWPKDQIDHIDRDRQNDRLSNLREATQSQNLANRAKWKSKSGLRGVYPHGNKWIAKATVGKVVMYLGLFSSKDDAARAYDLATKNNFGVFAELNFPTSG